jgi:hypothetical protein
VSLSFRFRATRTFCSSLTLPHQTFRSLHSGHPGLAKLGSAKCVQRVMKSHSSLSDFDRWNFNCGHDRPSVLPRRCRCRQGRLRDVASIAQWAGRILAMPADRANEKYLTPSAIDTDPRPAPERSPALGTIIPSMIWFGARVLDMRWRWYCVSVRTSCGSQRFQPSGQKNLVTTRLSAAFEAVR